MIASEEGNSSCFDASLKDGADVNATNDEGDSALMLASRTAHKDCIKLLLDSGTHVTKKNEKFLTALVSARINNQNDIISLLLEYECKVFDVCIRKRREDAVVCS